MSFGRGESAQRGATSVIGVVLLVAITVLLGATVAVFGLGYAEQTQDVPPESAFEFEYANSTDTASYSSNVDSSIGSDNLTVVYTHGEPVPSSRVNLTVTGAKSRSQNGAVLTTDLTFEPDYKGGGNLFSNTDTISAGDRYTASDYDFVAPPSASSSTLGNNAKLDLSEATVRIYWVSPDGDTSAVIATWTGPEA